MPTSQIIITVTSDDPDAVEQYVRDTIDNADPAWVVDSAELTTDNVTTDLLEDVEDLDVGTAESQSVEETQTQTQNAPETQELPQDSDPTRLPTGKEF